MYQAIVARVRTKPHPNADRLQLGEVCGTQVVLGMNTQDNELGVYFPSDGLLSHEYCVANDLYTKSARAILELPESDKIGYFDHKRRIRTQKFRGEQSDGLWMPLESLDYLFGGPGFYALNEGDMFDTIHARQICEKWYSRKPSSGPTNAKPRRHPKGTLLMFPKHVDTAQWDYYKEMIPLDSLLTISEKLHGTSHRVGLVLDEDRKWWQFWKPRWTLVHGTRNVVQTPTSQGYYADESFRQKAVGEPKLRKGEVLYGEIVGWCSPGAPIMPSAKVNKADLMEEHLRYGSEVHYHYGLATGHAEFYVYRIVQFNEDGIGCELSDAQMRARARELGYQCPPELWRSILVNIDETDHLVASCVGATSAPSQVCPDQMAEGVVIRVDAPDGTTQFYKKKSFAFKLLEGIIKSNDEYVDIEEGA